MEASELRNKNAEELGSSCWTLRKEQFKLRMHAESDRAARHQTHLLREQPAASPSRGSRR
jgi:ribosomal protein L29